MKQISRGITHSLNPFHPSFFEAELQIHAIPASHYFPTQGPVDFNRIYEHQAIGIILSHPIAIFPPVHRNFAL